MDNQLQHKLFAFEAAPPEALWQRIAVELDEYPTFADNLHEYSEAPGDLVWKRIENELNETTPARLIPFTTRYKKPLRYASAAAIIGIILVVNTLVTKRTEAGALAPTKQGSAVLTLPAANTNSPSKKDNPLPPVAAEWVTYRDANGDSMRIPRKLFVQLQCKNGDNACRKRIAKLREKLSSANTTSDFTGLLEMVRQIK